LETWAVTHDESLSWDDGLGMNVGSGRAFTDEFKQEAVRLMHDRQVALGGTSAKRAAVKADWAATDPVTLVILVGTPERAVGNSANRGDYGHELPESGVRSVKVATAAIRKRPRQATDRRDELHGDFVQRE
jgi:hypothetical protein